MIRVGVQLVIRYKENTRCIYGSLTVTKWNEMYKIHTKFWCTCLLFEEFARARATFLKTDKMQTYFIALRARQKKHASKNYGVHYNVSSPASLQVC